MPASLRVVFVACQHTLLCYLFVSINRISYQAEHTFDEYSDKVCLFLKLALVNTCVTRLCTIELTLATVVQYMANASTNV